MRNYARPLCVVGEAIGDCTNAIESRPKDAQGYIQRGYLHLFGGDYDLAAMDFDMATSLHPVDEHLRQRMDKLGCILGATG